MTFVRHAINDGWTVEPIGDAPCGQIAATVPGCIHLDLIREGIIPHPDEPGGEEAQQWVGRTSFLWRRVIPAAEDARTVVFESIDTAARVLFDGKMLGCVRNQFHPHRFELPPGEGVLEVEIAAPLVELERLVEEYGDRPVNADGAWGVYSYLRKSACSFGWDWGPMCPGAGLLGPVWLEASGVSRIVSVDVVIGSCSAERAEVEVVVETVGEGTTQLRMMGPDGASIELNDRRATIEAPALWWPRDLGAQPLYTIEVVLLEGDSRIDCAVKTIGLRDVGLATEGGAFALSINGVKTFCRGANWIPDGLFPGTASAERVRERVQQAFDANMNMLRVWGGGAYEHEAFYEACDRLGIMVWQDFMFACATYPEEAPFPELIEEEVRFQLARLRTHPSVVLWCGGNENVLAWRSWGWRERMDSSQTWGKQYFTELLPRLCRELDPSRPYLPDSPWSGTVEADPNDPTLGDRHTWDLKLDAIRSMVPRFASEFGHQGPPTIATVKEALGEVSISSLAPRQRAWGGDGAEYDNHLAAWFGSASTEEGQLVQRQVLQARATSIAFEWLRANSPRCRGALIWQLNDAWTGHSWSLIDVRGRPKPAYWAASRACEPRLVTIQPFGGGLHAVLVNDTSEGWRGQVAISRRAFDGATLEEMTEEVDLPAGATTRVPVPPAIATAGNPATELLVAEAFGRRATWFFGPDLTLQYPEPEFELIAKPGEGFQLKAHSLLRDVVFQPSGALQDDYLTLLSGESKVVRCSEAVAQEILQSQTVRSAGGLFDG